MYEVVFFDFDGTIVDSGEGIKESVKKSLEEIGIKEEREDVLNSFIGPPLFDSYMKHYDITPEVADRAVENYRKHYRNGGLKKFKVYEGVEKMLKDLNNAGVKVCLATAKPKEFAETMLDSIDFSKYFYFINGASFDASKRTKTAVIKDNLEKLDFDKSTIVMIGDRENDITGAKNCGLDSIGVLYGFGSEEELRDAGCTKIAKTPEDVVKEVLK